MKRRILAGVLWFVATAYAWNAASLVLGVSSLPALALGLLAAFVVAGDPMHRIWTGREGS